MFAPSHFCGEILNYKDDSAFKERLKAEVEDRSIMKTKSSSHPLLIVSKTVHAEFCTSQQQSS